MTFATDVIADVLLMHEDWERDDIGYINRTVTGKSLVGSTAVKSDDAPVTITGVFTILNDALKAELFGGMSNVSAVMMLKPAVLVAAGITLDDEDIFTVDGETYGIEELREEKVDDQLHQYYLSLKQL